MQRFKTVTKCRVFATTTRFSHVNWQILKFEYEIKHHRSFSDMNLFNNNARVLVHFSREVIMHVTNFVRCFITGLRAAILGNNIQKNNSLTQLWGGLAKASQVLIVA